MPTVTKKVPVLDERGWLSDIDSRIDTVFSRCFLNLASQNLLFPDAFSVQKVIQKYGRDKYTTMSELEKGFNNVLSLYFETVNIIVIEDSRYPQENNKYYLSIRCDITDQGESAVLGRVLSIEGTVFQTISDQINNGASL